MSQDDRAEPERLPLSRERVLAAALAIADEQGIEALSMRRLGQALGVEAMSLYKHVKNKEDLLDGLVELVVEEIEPPAIGGDWKQELRGRSRSAHEAYLRHPWALALIMSRANVGPAMLRYVDATIGCLRAAGFDWADADHAWNALDAFVYGFTLQQLRFPFEPEEYAEAAEAYLPQLPPELSHLRGMSEEVIAGRHDGQHRLDFGLELLLEGLERRLEADAG